VVAEKTHERSYEDAWRELRRSLELLDTKYFDTYQLHAVNTFEELEQVFSEKGAPRAFIEAREQGISAEDKSGDCHGAQGT